MISADDSSLYWGLQLCFSHVYETEKRFLRGSCHPSSLLLVAAQQENPLHGLPVAPSHWDLWGNRGRERWGLKGTVKPPCVQEQDMLKRQLRDMQRCVFL